LKRSRGLAVAVVALVLLSSLPVQLGAAQTAYSEKLNVFIAGSDALWYMTFNGVNGSSGLNAFENTSGLTAFNLTAIQTTGWASDFQVFGPKGYNLLQVPFLPPQGLFLTVASDTATDASSAAEALNSYMLSAFVLWSSGNGTYTFYSPLSFSSVVPRTLLKLVPTAEGGFAAAITSTGFMGTSSPMVTLEGRRSGSVFEHTLVLGSITASALSSNKPSVLSYFGTTLTSLQASNHTSQSSSILVKALDGVIVSSDSAASVSSDTTHFTGSYELNLAPGTKVDSLNATVLEQPVQMLATRTVNTGVLYTGDNVTVTLTIQDLSTTVGVKNITFSDNWWNSSQFAGLFSLVKGDNDTVQSNVGAGVTVTPDYRLTYVGTVVERITIPASVVRYSYSVGGTVFHGSATLNPVPLSLGRDDAVVYAYLAPSGSFGKSVGDVQNMTIVATNVGTEPASSVTVAGKPLPSSGLAACGALGCKGTAVIPVQQSAQGLLGINLTAAYSVTYQNPNAVSFSTQTNTIDLVFSHTAMKVAFVSLVAAEQLSPIPAGGFNLTLTFITSNKGPVNATSFSAIGSLPAGLSNGTESGSGISFSAGKVALNYSSIGSLASKTAYLKINVTDAANFLVSPVSFQASSGIFPLTGWSNGLAIPTGLTMTKGFFPSLLFAGMTSRVEVVASNAGPYNFYNASVTSGQDLFDTPSSSSTLSGFSPLIAPGENLSFPYTVTALSKFGNNTAAGVSASFYFGGSVFSLVGPGPKVSIYEPLNATITTNPESPIEGKSFTIVVTITNPTGVAVSDVSFKLPIPPGLTLSNLANANLTGGALTIFASSLGPHSTVSATSVGVAASGITIPFDNAILTFAYGGVTVKGVLPRLGIAVGENVTYRYLIPIGIVLLALLATAYYVRRRAGPTVPTSQR
jgi:hypothetical protein